MSQRRRYATFNLRLDWIVNLAPEIALEFEKQIRVVFVWNCRRQADRRGLWCRRKDWCRVL